MFLRSTNRKKDGKDHRYFSIVENRRLPGGKTVQRMVLSLGEINDQQQAAWRKPLEVFDEAEQRFTTMSLFPDDSPASRRCGGRRTGSAERSGIEAATRVRQLLVSLRVVAATGSG
jgi:hypothetical protein